MKKKLNNGGYLGLFKENRGVHQARIPNIYNRFKEINAMIWSS